MSLEFLAPGAAVAGERFAPVARTPMERPARAAGARFETRDGWNVAVGYSSLEQEREACRRAAGWADVSHLGKLEVLAAPDDLAAIVREAADGATLELGTATRAAGAWWLPLTRDRALAVSEAGATGALRERLEAVAGGGASGQVTIVDATCKFAALALVGPLAREVFARFSAIDVRPHVLPVAGLRPGSIARSPGVLVREGEERFLLMIGWALGQYLWETVSDAGAHLGGAPVGLDALAEVAIGIAPVREEASRA